VGNSRRRKVRFWITLWFLVVTAISLAPVPVKKLIHTRGPWHDSGHVLIFFVTETLVLSVSRQAFSRVLGTAAILAFCIATEEVQAVMGRNRFEWHDLSTDALGIGCALIAVLVLQNWLEDPNILRHRAARHRIVEPFVP
jgi:hypothetical protein